MEIILAAHLSLELHRYRLHIPPPTTTNKFARPYLVGRFQFE